MTDEAKSLRRYLREIVSATPTDGIANPGFWVGDKAAERRAIDDLRAGRLHWRSAHDHARRGIEALDAGDMDLAETCLNLARRSRWVALEAKLTPAIVADLNNSARPRGRKPRNDARNRLLVKAVREQEKAGREGKAARAEAIRANPALDEVFGGLTDAALRKIIRETKIL